VCLRRLRELVDRQYFVAVPVTAKEILDCATASVELPPNAAADACRSLLTRGVTTLAGLPFLVDVFDRAGLPDIAERIDPLPASTEAWGGASLAHVRAARRALARHESRKARALAQQVVEAWTDADVALPVVAEMKALLARLPP
jgi:hypothetical protein